MDKDGVIYHNIYLFCHRKHVDSILSCVCSVIDHRCQNVVKISVTHSATSCVLLICTYHVLTVCDLLVNRRMATWELIHLYLITGARWANS